MIKLTDGSFYVIMPLIKELLRQIYFSKYKHMQNWDLGPNFARHNSALFLSSRCVSLYPCVIKQQCLAFLLWWLSLRNSKLLTAVWGRYSAFLVFSFLPSSPTCWGAMMYAEHRIAYSGAHYFRSFPLPVVWCDRCTRGSTCVVLAPCFCILYSLLEQGENRSSLPSFPFVWLKFN